MSILYEKEASFHSSEPTWYGERFYFEQKNKWSKEVLEVTVYTGGFGVSFRYISQKGGRFTAREGMELDYKDETLPFWVRKVFYHYARMNLEDWV